MSSKKGTTRSAGRPGQITIRRLVPVKEVTDRQIRRAVQAALADHPLLSLSVAVVDDAAIAALHQRYLHDPAATDVLSFDLRDRGGGEALEGEVIVSADAARRQGRALKIDAAQELLRYVIHGVLHLRGFRDDTAPRRGRMRRAENKILAILKKTRPERKKRHGPRRKSPRV